MPRPTGRRSAVCAALWEVMMLPCKYKQRSLAVLSLIMEAVSILLDKYEKQLLAVIAAFLLAVVGFAISIFPGIKKNARLRNAKQDQVVQFVLSLIQFSAAFWQLVKTVSNEEDKINFSIYFPLAIATIAVIFALIKKPRQSDSQSGSLPLKNPPCYNSVPGSPDNGSDELRIPMGEENESCTPPIRTLNNSAPGSTPVEPDGHIGISADEENVESPLTSSEPATLPGSTPIEPDGQNRISIGAENAELPQTPSEPASLSSRTPIEPDRVLVDRVSPLSSVRRRSNIAPSITSFYNQIERHFRNQIAMALLKEQIERRRREHEKVLKIEEKMRQIRPQDQARWAVEQLAEPQASTSKPDKKIARLCSIKPVTKPVANVPRPSATVRRRGKKRM